jgi:hypothetical protein
VRAVKPANPTKNGESLWPRSRGLPLVIEACEYDRLHAVLAYEFERITTHVRLVGAGADELGEDVSVFREDGTALHETRPSLPLEGKWTLAGFCDKLAKLELWPEPPEWDVARRFRNWAFESAALDLAPSEIAELLIIRRKTVERHRRECAGEAQALATASNSRATRAATASSNRRTRRATAYGVLTSGA